ncbi:MAG TPA: PqiC family protein [Candidimonas sp.]|nr:PqiC family protein [Candidimonas sp.]
MTLRISLCWAILAAALSGCASSPVQYYTLQPLADSQPVRRAGSSAPVPKAGGPRYAVSVQHVSLPEQVDRPQIVVSDPDSAQVVPLNSALWASPLSDQIRRSLAEDLSRRLDVLDIPSGSAPDGLGIWKVIVRVQRFESIYGRHAGLDATWELVPSNLPGRKPIICRGETRVPVQTGMSAMVTGHREALRRLASVIAGQLPSGAAPAPAADVVLKGCTR